MLYSVGKFILKPIYSVLYKIKVEGLENIPENAPYIVCANHMSAQDPVIIGVAFPHRIYSMAKAELFKNKLVGMLLRNLGVFPVKRGEADIKSIRTSLKLLNENKILGIFPEGTRNKTGEIMAEPGVAMLAIKARVPVVPMAIISNYKAFNKTTIKIGKPHVLEQYYDQKLKNEDYAQISYDIMNSISKLIKG